MLIVLDSLSVIFFNVLDIFRDCMLNILFFTRLHTTTTKKPIRFTYKYNKQTNKTKYDIA